VSGGFPAAKNEQKRIYRKLCRRRGRVSLLHLSVRSLRLPGHWHETNRQNCVALKLNAMFPEHHQFLVPGGPNGDNHAATIFEFRRCPPITAASFDSIDYRGSWIVQLGL